MDASRFANSPAGRLEETTNGALAFVPIPLPRLLELSAERVYQLDEASRAVATLAGAGETLPNPHLLIAPFMRREALLSSRIEGTQASVSDVYAAEATGRPHGDADEVVNYVRALELGIERLAELPICTRLVLELHAELLSGVRGQDKRPGELRDLQVWIGSEQDAIEAASFVPPPPDYLADLMSEWEAFVHDEAAMPPLVRSALMHQHFETIHPFRDGNGRIGRLLITLLLIERGVLRSPLLYLSAYFEAHRQAYYDHLSRVSETGDWDPWLDFFLSGVAEQSLDAVRRTRALRDLQDEYRQRLLAASASANAIQMADELFLSPIVTYRRVAEFRGVTDAGARIVVSKLVEAGILRPSPGTRPQLFAARELLDLLQ